MVQHLVSRGVLTGHSDWVTSIATSFESSNMIISGSRDKTLIVWELTPQGENYGYARKALTGHNQAVQDVCLSATGEYAISASWDKTLRMWDLNKGTCMKTFKGHKSDVFSVSYSADNRHIVSAGRDKTIKVWNNIGVCMYTIEDEKHNDWVSCVRITPSAKQPLIVSAGWDKVVKVWNLSNCKHRANMVGHSGVINTLTVSPDGSLCATGGKGGDVHLWDVNECQHLYTLSATNTVNALAFSPNRYWLCAGTDKGIVIIDLESKSVIDEIVPPSKYKSPLPWIVSLTWSADGNTLFAGSSDGNIYVYDIAAE